MEHSDQRQIGAHRTTDAGKVHCKHIRRPQIGPIEKLNRTEKFIAPEVEGKHEIDPISNQPIDQANVAQGFAAHNNGHRAHLKKSFAIGNGLHTGVDPKRCCWLYLRNCTDARKVVATLPDCIQIGDIESVETTDFEQCACHAHGIAAFAQGRAKRLVSGAIAAPGMNDPVLQQVYDSYQSHGSGRMQ